jgi:hypothetical protein
MRRAFRSSDRIPETPQLGGVEKFPDSALAVHTSHERRLLVGCYGQLLVAQFHGSLSRMRSPVRFGECDRA